MDMARSAEGAVRMACPGSFYVEDSSGYKSFLGSSHDTLKTSENQIESEPQKHKLSTYSHRYITYLSSISFLIIIQFNMRFAPTLPLVALSFAALASGAPLNIEQREPAENDLLTRANPKFDYPGSPDELDKRANPKFDYPGSPDELE